MSSYSFMDVTATLAGVGAIIDLGYGSAVAEEGITVAMSGSRNTMTIGADGEGMHSRHANKSGTVTISLLKTSPANAKLLSLYSAQAAGSGNGWGQNMITIQNKGSGDKILCRDCAFQKQPDLKYAKEADTVSWVFDAIKIDTILGDY